MKLLTAAQRTPGQQLGDVTGLPGDLAGSLRQFLSAVDLSEEEYFSVFQSLRQEYAGKIGHKLVVVLTTTT